MVVIQDRDFKLQLVLRLRDYPKSRELLEYLHTNVANSAPQYQSGAIEREDEEREDYDVMALLVEHAISGLPHCNAVEDKESAQQAIFFGILFIKIVLNSLFKYVIIIIIIIIKNNCWFVKDMEAYSNSTFIPMSVMLDHLKTAPPGESQSYLYKFILLIKILHHNVIFFDLT